MRIDNNGLEEMECPSCSKTDLVVTNELFFNSEHLNVHHAIKSTKEIMKHLLRVLTILTIVKLFHTCLKKSSISMKMKKVKGLRSVLVTTAVPRMYGNQVIHFLEITTFLRHTLVMTAI